MIIIWETRGLPMYLVRSTDRNKKLMMIGIFRQENEIISCGSGILGLNRQITTFVLQDQSSLDLLHLYQSRPQQLRLSPQRDFVELQQLFLPLNHCKQVVDIFVLDRQSLVCLAQFGQLLPQSGHFIEVFADGIFIVLEGSRLEVLLILGQLLAFLGDTVILSGEFMVLAFKFAGLMNQFLITFDSLSEQFFELLNFTVFVFQPSSGDFPDPFLFAYLDFKIPEPQLEGFFLLTQFLLLLRKLGYSHVILLSLLLQQNGYPVSLSFFLLVKVSKLIQVIFQFEDFPFASPQIISEDAVLVSSPLMFGDRSLKSALQRSQINLQLGLLALGKVQLSVEIGQSVSKLELCRIFKRLFECSSCVVGQGTVFPDELVNNFFEIEDGLSFEFILSVLDLYFCKQSFSDIPHLLTFHLDFFEFFPKLFHFILIEHFCLFVFANQAEVVLFTLSYSVGSSLCLCLGLLQLLLQESHFMFEVTDEQLLLSELDASIDILGLHLSYLPLVFELLLLDVEILFAMASFEFLILLFEGFDDLMAILYLCPKSLFTAVLTLDRLVLLLDLVVGLLQLLYLACCAVQLLLGQILVKVFEDFVQIHPIVYITTDLHQIARWSLLISCSRFAILVSSSLTRSYVLLTGPPPRTASSTGPSAATKVVPEVPSACLCFRSLLMYSFSTEGSSCRKSISSLYLYFACWISPMSSCSRFIFREEKVYNSLSQLCFVAWPLKSRCSRL